MKNVCEQCRFAKPVKDGIYCVKYGIRTIKRRIYCVAFERGENEQIQGKEDGS